MKIVVCDVCKRRDKKLVESPRYYRWKSRETGSSLRVDVCAGHGEEIKGRRDLAKLEAAEDWILADCPPVGAPKAEAVKAKG